MSRSLLSSQDPYFSCLSVFAPKSHSCHRNRSVRYSSKALPNSANLVISPPLLSMTVLFCHRSFIHQNHQISRSLLVAISLQSLRTLSSFPFSKEITLESRQGKPI